MTDSSNDLTFSGEFDLMDHPMDDLQAWKKLHEGEFLEDGDGEKRLPTMRMLAEAGRQGRRNTENAQSDGEKPRFTQLDDYEIIREIGRGGMGLVFEARQISLDRRVALKVLSFRAMRNEEIVARFDREAQATASLEHPRIVRAYAHGEDRGIYYLAMQFIEGQNLAEFIRGRRAAICGKLSEVSNLAEAATLEFGAGSMASYFESSKREQEKKAACKNGANASSEASFSSSPPASYFREIARICQQVAEALQYAHEKQVIHRDIKPSNLILDQHGNVYIADFGLATLGNSQGLTATGRAFGTLRYSSPEQACGSPALDARTDVYSLGATLYELATLAPAFPGEEPVAMLHDIQEKEPIRPRKIVPNLPRDLESVILKAMSKNPQHRYQTSLAFAADLQHFLHHEPVLAKRPTIIEQGARWIHRNRLFSSLAASIFLLILFGMLGAAIHFEQREILLSRLSNSNTQLTKTLLDLKHTLDAERNTEQRLRQMVQTEERLSCERCYMADMINNASLANSGRYDLLPQRLKNHIPKSGKDDLRGFLWRYLRAASNNIEVTLSAHQCKLLSNAVAPSLRLLVTGDQHGKICVWNTTTWRQQTSLSFAGEVWDLKFSPDEKILAACGTEGVIQLYETDGWKLKYSLSAHEGTAKGLEFTPDGKILISCSRNHDIAYWDTETWREQRRFIAHRTVQHISMSSDGRWLASGGSDGWTKVWNIASGEQAAEIKGHAQTVLSTALSSDGSLVAAGGYEAHVCLSDRITSKQLANIALPGNQQAWSLRFSPDDLKLIVGTNTGHICTYDVSNPRVPRLMKATKTHDGCVRSLEYVNGTDQIVTTSDDTTARISFLTEKHLGKTLAVPYTRSVRFAPDGEHVTLANLDNGFNSWDRTGKQTGASANANLDTANDHFESPQQIAYTRNGLLWTARVSQTTASFSVLSPAGEIARYDVSSRHNLQRIWLSNNAERAFAFALDGYGILWSLDAAFGASTMAEFVLPADSNSVAFSPDNQTIAIATDTGEVHLLDCSNPAAQHPVLLSGEQVGLYAVAFSPSGANVAAGGYKGTVCVWDVASGELKQEMFHQSTIVSIAFSNDGRYLASAGRELRLWNTETGRFIMQLGPGYKHRNYEAIAFSPQDDCLVAVADQSDSGSLYICNVPDTPAE